MIVVVSAIGRADCWLRVCGGSSAATSSHLSSALVCVCLRISQLLFTARSCSPFALSQQPSSSHVRRCHLPQADLVPLALCRPWVPLRLNSSTLGTALQQESLLAFSLAHLAPSLSLSPSFIRALPSFSLVDLGGQVVESRKPRARIYRPDRSQIYPRIRRQCTCADDEDVAGYAIAPSPGILLSLSVALFGITDWLPPPSPATG